jgi:transposase InsO family protein
MSKSTRRSRHRQAGVSQLVAASHGGLWRLAAHPPADPSRQARARLAMLEWHAAHGHNVSLTARHFGFSRPTVYRWLRRFDPHRLGSLEDRSSRPQRCRRPTWTSAQLDAVKQMREAYPRWGKAKLAVLLRREGRHSLSVSMTGRILVRLLRTGELREPRPSRARTHKRRQARPHAIRKPRDYAVERPGDLVQVDTLDVRMPGWSRPLKQFTARDVVSRWDTLELARSASARNAATILDALTARLPFGLRAVQVDGGSEFMAEFETACVERDIRLFVLPPRSPKLNGHVERANGTHTTEFWELSDAEPELEPLRAALLAWETCYDTVRPHQALGYLTPAEWLERQGILVPGV